MKAKNVIGKIYVSSNANLGHSETFCRASIAVRKKLFIPPTQFVIDQKKISLTERSSVCVMLN